ncbi:MAG: HDOD domain-containing protein [Methylococcaceae bacterium]|nr:HDOD domain-containing protein [Methylococcaceae bacterium]
MATDGAGSRFAKLAAMMEQAGSRCKQWPGSREAKAVRGVASAEAPRFGGSPGGGPITQATYQPGGIRFGTACFVPVWVPAAAVPAATLKSCGPAWGPCRDGGCFRVGAGVVNQRGRVSRSARRFAMVWLVVSFVFAALIVVIAVSYRRRARGLKEIERAPDPPAESEAQVDWDSSALPSYQADKIVPRSILKLLEPMASWHDEQLAVFAPEHRSETYPAGFLLFQRDELTDHAFYLLKGEVELKFELREPAIFSALDPEARYPLGCGTRFPVTCISHTEVEMLRVPQALLCADRNRQEVHGIDTAAMDLPPVLAGSAAFHAFCRSFESRELQLPSIPQVALRLRQVIRKPEVDLDEVAKLVQVDPALSAKLIHVANSPLYLSVQPVSTCHGAVVRLGLEATHNVVCSIGMRQLFSARHTVIKRRVEQIWDDGLTVSAISSVLAAKLASVDSDKALLAGLIYRIGAIPFLKFVDELPADACREEEIDAALELLTVPVGRYVLQEWDFPQEYLELPEQAERWFVDSGPRIDLGDVVRLAVWHARLAQRGKAALPPIIALPSFAKLENRGLTAEFSLNLLRQAQAQIDATRKILAG